jgi:ABC-type polysaccharide/polyol phosphate export permease
MLTYGHMATTTSTEGIRPSRRAVQPGSLTLILTGFREIWSRRRLARYLVKTDLVKHGANTILGNVWWILDPLLQMAVYVFVVSIIFRSAAPDYPLFVFSAILPWKWFNSSVNDATGAVVSKERIIKQVHFPKIVLPVASTLSGIVNFVFGLIPLVGLLLLFYRDRASVTILLIPLIAAVQLVFTLAIAVFISAINVFYRDVGNVARHILRLWFYASPALYSADKIAHLDSYPVLMTLFQLNPWATLFESYRSVIYYDTLPAWGALSVLLLFSFALLCVAVLFFKRVEPAFAKIL